MDSGDTWVLKNETMKFVQKNFELYPDIRFGDSREIVEQKIKEKALIGSFSPHSLEIWNTAPDDAKLPSLVDLLKTDGRYAVQRRPAEEKNQRHRAFFVEPVAT
ncbi:MAG: hypothetical protein K9G62_01880 [Alphaproteobacteria bacterium]|nr:hypothetical protein [Alphaproteobacteria bacterium]